MESKVTKKDKKVELKKSCYRCSNLVKVEHELNQNNQRFNFCELRSMTIDRDIAYTCRNFSPIKSKRHD